MFKRFVDCGISSTSRHCFRFYSVRAWWRCGDSLPDIDPESNKQIKLMNSEKLKVGKYINWLLLHFWHCDWPKADSDDVWEEQGRDEDFEKFRGEHAPFLHHAALPHTEGAWTPRMLEVKLPEDKQPLSYISSRTTQ